MTASPRLHLCIVIVNYRTPQLVVDCLRSLQGELEPGRERVVVVDNRSGDDSAERIDRAIEREGWSSWVQLIRSPVNGGFSAGNNVGIRACDADFYLLLNSDTLVRPGAIRTLTAAMQSEPDVGLAGPRLEWPDGTPQISCFREHSPWSELIGAAQTRPVTQLLTRHEVPIQVDDREAAVEWTSFACVMIRREVIDRIGLLDEGYFMYFEDCDYCRRARVAGFRIGHYPQARVVHLRGGTSDVKAKMAARRRPPRYLYASRTRYFYKRGGLPQLLAANLAWSAGRAVSLLRELAGNKAPHTCERQWLDNWTDAVKTARGARPGAAGRQP